MGLLSLLGLGHPSQMQDPSAFLPGMGQANAQFNSDTPFWQQDTPITHAPGVIPQAAQAALPVPQGHRGILDVIGVKGGLRDVLGGLGDAFLIQSGNAPRYGPGKDAEAIGQIIGQSGPDGLTQQQLGQIGSIDPSFLDKYQTHQDNAAYRNAMLDARKSHWGTMDARTAAATKKVYIDSALRKLAAAKDPDSYSEAKAQVVDALARQGMDLSDLPPLPENWSEGVRELGGDPLKWANYHQTVSHQGAMEDIGHQNADANTTKAGAAATNAATGQARQTTNERESPSRISKNEGQGAYYRGKSTAGPPLPGGSPQAAPTAGGTPPKGQNKGNPPPAPPAGTRPGATRPNLKTGYNWTWDGHSWH